VRWIEENFSSNADFSDIIPEIDEEISLIPVKSTEIFGVSRNKRNDFLYFL